MRGERKRTDAHANLPPSLCLKRLPECDKDLGGLQSGNRIQVSTDIDPHGSHRRLITDAEAQGVTVIIEQTSDVNSIVHIAAVIEDHAPQPFLERYRKASLGIQDEELLPTDGNANQCRTSRGIIFLSAKSGYPLGSCAIQRETSQAVRSAGEKPLADRDV